MDTIRESALIVDWEKNLLPHQGLELALVLCLSFFFFRSDMLPNEHVCCMYVCTHMCVCVCMRLCVHVCVCVCMCVCAHKFRKNGWNLVRLGFGG